jgi:hypothetical protein
VFVYKLSEERKAKSGKQKAENELFLSLFNFSVETDLQRHPMIINKRRPTTLATMMNRILVEAKHQFHRQSPHWTSPSGPSQLPAINIRMGVSERHNSRCDVYKLHTERSFIFTSLFLVDLLNRSHSFHTKHMIYFERKCRKWSLICNYWKGWLNSLNKYKKNTTLVKQIWTPSKTNYNLIKYKKENETGIISLSTDEWWGSDVHTFAAHI